MAFFSLTITVHMFIIILGSIWANSANGLLIVKPQDTHVLAGQQATLNCSTSSTEDVHWYYGTSTSYVYAGRKLYYPYDTRLKIEVFQYDGTTAFNLVFPSTKPEDAGTYICRDNQGRGETSSVEMTVFTAEGNRTCQSNMKPDGVVIPNDCNIDPDEVQLSCSVTFYGNYPPQLEWKKVPEDGSSVANTECQTINTRVTCNTSITGDRQMNGSSYVCRAAGSSQGSISLCNMPVKNLLYAFNGNTTRHLFVGNEVQCNLETSQSCNYKWKHYDTVVSAIRAITPDRTGLHQCEAECNFRGKRCIVFGYVYVNDGDSTSCSTGCVFGICIGLLILILVIVILIIVIHRFLLKTEKGERLELPNKTRNERDLEMKSAGNGTQQEQRNLMQPCENFETNKTRNERDLEMKSAGNGTQQEQRNLMQPCENFETTSRIALDKTRNERYLEMKSAGNGTQQEQRNLMQPCENFETVVDEPKFIQTLIPSAATNKKQAVFAVAILGDELFASSHDYPKIEVFGDLRTLESRREIVLAGNKLYIPWDLQSSSKYNCLYVVGVWANEEQTTEIFRIDRQGTVQLEWRTSCKGGRLSITHEFNVVVTSHKTHEIHEYSPNGRLIRSIKLPSDVGIANPWVTLKRKENEYIISYGNRGDSRHGVCVIDERGSIKQHFGGKKGSGHDQLYIPVHMAAASNGHIFVADKDNSRVVLLSPKLKFIKTLFWQGDCLRFPNCLCLDEQNKRLFVSDNQWISSMKPWTGGRILVFDVESAIASLDIALKPKREACCSTP